MAAFASCFIFCREALCPCKGDLDRWGTRSSQDIIQSYLPCGTRREVEEIWREGREGKEKFLRLCMSIWNMYKVQFFLLYTSMHMRRESKPHENLLSQRNERSFRLCTYITLILSSMSYERYNALVTISLKPHSRICLSFCFGDWLEKCLADTH